MTALRALAERARELGVSADALAGLVRSVADES